MKIKSIKKVNNKYKIELDNEVITTTEDVILNEKLLFKKDITIEEYYKILEQTHYYESYNKVVKYVLKSKKSEKEIEDYIIKLGVSNEDKTKIITKLKELKLINDIDYCKSFINDKVILNKWGINKIIKELNKKNIEESIISQCIKEINLKEIDLNLENIIKKKMRSNNKYSNNMLKQKILNEMINAGYDSNKIINIIDKNITPEENTIIVKEYNKLKNKLQKKYSNGELNFYIKNKLLAKGFSIDKINEIIKTEE